MSALKFKAARVHFLSEGFQAVAFVDALAPSILLLRTKLFILCAAMLMTLVPNNNNAPAYIFLGPKSISPNVSFRSLSANCVNPNTDSSSNIPSEILMLKQQRQRRLRKRHLKVDFALSQTLSRLLQKGMMHVQGCCFADLTCYFFAVLVAVAVAVAVVVVVA